MTGFPFLPHNGWSYLRTLRSQALIAFLGAEALLRSVLILLGIPVFGLSHEALGLAALLYAILCCVGSFILGRWWRRRWRDDPPGREGFRQAAAIALGASLMMGSAAGLTGMVALPMMTLLLTCLPLGLGLGLRRRQAA